MGFTATRRLNYKEKHLVANLYLSVTYWDPQHEQVCVDCLTS